MKTTMALWSLNGICMLVGSFVLYNGGWSRVVRSPFPLQLTRTVYATNYVDVPHHVIVYDQRTPDPPKPIQATNASVWFTTNDPAYVTNLYVTNIFSFSYFTNTTTPFR